MWNESFKWFFEEGTPNGFNDGGIAEFASTKYDGLAREIIQNSLDAQKDESEPVVVSFEKISVSIDMFPDIDGYISSTQKCIDFLKDDIGNKSIKKLEGIKSYLNYCKKNGSFNILKISDYNTKGLSGANKTYGTPWANLVRISGNSNKGPGSQGSFGIGKYAPFVFSNIRSIIYSTKDEDGNIAVQGKSILSGHIDDGNTRTPFGYYGKKYRKIVDGKEHDDSQAIFEDVDIPEMFVRKETGTTLYIMCANTPIGWHEEILSSVVNSFFYAIHNNNLVVEIKDNLKETNINADNLKEKIIELCSRDDATKEIKTTRDIYKIFENADNVKKASHTFNLPNNQKGTMDLYLFTDKSIESKSIAHLRKAGMKIEERNPRSLSSYVGIAVTSNDEMNEFLTTCEAPKHDSWSSNNCGDEEQQTVAKKILSELTSWEREEVKQLTPINESERLDPLGMEEFLASDIESEEESNNSGTEIINFKPLETEIKKKKNSKQTFVVANSIDGIITDGSGEVEIEGPNGRNNGKGGSGMGSGGPGTGGGSGGTQKDKEKLPIKNIKTPYMNEPGKYIISFVPEVSKNDCELKVRLAGEDVFENINILKKYILDENGKREVNKFNLNMGEKITFEVYFENVDRAALEVSCYAKK